MKELINNIDNWTFIKMVGGFTIVFSSVISFVAYFIKDYFINKWKSKYQNDLELLKADTNKNNSILNNLTNSLSNIYLFSNNKRLEALEKVWVTMMEIKEIQPNLTFLSYTLLTKEEFLELPTTDNKYSRECIDSFKPQKYFEDHFKLIDKITKTRPFIGEKLWLIFFAYQAFLGRLNHLLQDGLEKRELKYWHDDTQFINQILGVVIQPDELKKLLVSNSNSFNNILNFLEYKAISDINEQISGKRMSEESVNHAIKLSNMTRNISVPHSNA